MIELHSTNTANGQKVSLMLEECGLEYRMHEVNLVAGDHLKPEFLGINPFGKIPAIVDRDGPGGTPIAVSQSLAILRYLADKTGRFLPDDPRARAEADQYLALVASDMGAAFSGIFMFGTLPTMSGGEPVASAVDYFTSQVHRGLRVLDARLTDAAYLAGEGYSIADILALPVAVTSVQMLGEAPLAPYPAIVRWVAMLAERPAVQRILGANLSS